MAERDNIRAMLAYIPAHDRDLWLRIGMAIKSELGEEGFPIWNEWSQGDDSYNERDAANTWRSFKPNGGINIGTLYYEAQQRGFRYNGHERTYSASDGGNYARNGDQADEGREHCEHEEVRERAKRILSVATGDPSTHPYWIKKRINLGPHVRRGRWPQRGWHDALLIPIYQCDGHICSIEAINVDGDKDSLKGGKKSGGFYPFGRIRGASKVLVGEGVADVAVAVDAEQCAAVAALSASVLQAAAKAVRALAAPGADLVILANNDVRSDGTANTGLDKAIKAARAVDGRVAIPELEGRKCDFWDLWNERGAVAVKAAIANAIAPGPDEWPEPQPLVVGIEPKPYPLDALPKTLRQAVEEVQAFTKAPMSLVASCALSAISLAIQGHVDVKRADKLTGPVSLFVLTIADSGERKTTCDQFFTVAIREYQLEQAEAAKEEMKKYNADLEAWKAKRAAILDAIRQDAKKGGDTSTLEARLRYLEKDEPKPPRVAKLMLMDETPEDLAWVLAHEWPSGGVVSSEAGIVFGSHGMGTDSVMRNLALLNILWDGGSFSKGRRTSGSFTVRGARLTMGLQVQEAPLREFFDRSHGLARGTGFLARFLLAFPESTQGSRPFSEPPSSWPSLSAFNKRIRELLDSPAPIDENGALSPAMLTLSADAKTKWIAFHDAIESELRMGGELYDVRDVASKIAENAVRVAGLFLVFRVSPAAEGNRLR